MQEMITYFDYRRYDNLNSLEEGGKPKAAKLSTFKNFYPKTKEIMKHLRVTQTEETPSVEVSKTPDTSVTSMENVSKITEENKTQVAESSEPKDNIVKFPTKESLQARIPGVTIYNEFVPEGTVGSNRKLRVAPQVVDFLKYATNTLGKKNTSKVVEESDEVSVSTPESTSKVETKTFDFGSLPGVGETTTSSSSEEEPVHGDYLHTEQDNRLNDYLNRESSNVNFSSSNLSDLEEIRNLKKKIEEARNTLRQVKGNVGDLQQRDAEISEQLAKYKESLMAQIDAVNEQIGAETTEWNNLTQLVKEKENILKNNNNDLEEKVRAA